MSGNDQAPPVSQPAMTSLAAQVTPIEAGAHVTAAAFLGGTPALALGDGSVLLGEAGASRRVAAHPDAAILVATSEGERLLSGGDDGRVVATRADGSFETMAEEKGRWIDAVVLRGDGAIAWSAGKTVRARDAKGKVQTFTAASSVRGLAFFPKGYRVACAHYNGVSAWLPNIAGEPESFEWKGSHLDVTLSPDGRFLVTSMQENALHGWRVADKTHMRMAGYPKKTRSLSWSPDGAWLATSGAEACVVWPFRAKDGPMGKAPLQCGVRPASVSCVAFHPVAHIVALGYEDGWVMLCRLEDASEILVRAPGIEDGAGAITALAWERGGGRLLFGSATGQAGILSLPR